MIILQFKCNPFNNQRFVLKQITLYLANAVYNHF
jgi:hypothetical protein